MKTLNDVDEASRESFPASDAPAAGGMTRMGAPARDLPAAPGGTSAGWFGDGIRAGLLGFAAIALTFAIVDIASGESPFYTAALLGSSLILGVADPAEVSVSFPAVAAYTVAHLMVFLGLGIGAGWLAGHAEHRGRPWLIASFVLVLVALHFTAAVQAIAAPVRAVLPAAAIWVSGIAAGVLMAGYLVWSRRQ